MNETNPTTHTEAISERNLRLVNLAHECVFLKTSEKETTLTILNERVKDEPDTDVVDIFKEEEFISEKRIEYLLAFDEHLKIQYQDQQFGELATANGLATKEDIANALHYQKKYFKQNRISILIGDILVGNGTLSHGDRAAILITQNRVKTDQLAETIQEIGISPLEKETINKRFGVMAIKKGLVTREQVIAALEIQTREKENQKEARFIGEILQETTDLSFADIDEILLEQKQFEKRRLDLEKALYSLKSELNISQKLNRLFYYRLSTDQLEAFVKKQKDITEKVSVYEFLIWLRRVGITYGMVNDTLLEEFLNHGPVNTEIRVAKGLPSEPPIDETLQVYFENDFFPVESIEDVMASDETIENSTINEHDQNDSDQNDIKEDDSKDPGQPDDADQEENEHEPDLNENDPPESNKPEPVEKGAILARICPGKPGKLGKDVMGHIIQPQKPSNLHLIAGNGVVKENDVFLAQAGGYPEIKNGTTLMIRTETDASRDKTIIGPVSEDTKDKFEQSNVILNNNITHEGVLRCHDLLLEGHMAGTVLSKGRVQIRGQIGTEDHPSSITSNGTIKVSKTIVNTILQTGDELIALQSSVFGSSVTALNGITIKDCLNTENQCCTLQIGFKPEDKILSLIHTIQAKQAERAVLEKETEINELTQEYLNEKKTEENHLLEQDILKNMVEIIEGPELYQYEGLEDKIKYLKELPEYSSIKEYYLKLPETQEAHNFIKPILLQAQKTPLEELAEQLKKKIEPDPEDENAQTELYKIEANFKARLAEIEKEVVRDQEEIDKLNEELKKLADLKTKLITPLLSSIGKSSAYITIRNQCEKGTLIKGKMAVLQVDKTMYNVTFKEIIDPQTNEPVIQIEA